MRILDIGIASAYALLCLSLISFMSPLSSQTQAAQAAENVAANSAIFSYIGSVGLPYLSTAQPLQVCSSLLSAGNATIVLGGAVAGYSCSVAPTSYVGSSSLSFSLQGRTVVIEAWVTEEQ